MSKLLLTIGITMTLIGCSSSPNEELLEEQLAIEEQRQEIEIERMELKQDMREEEVDNVPKWALNPPKSDEQGFYGVGIATSNDLSLAMKKAKLMAEFELAKQYKQSLSGSERSFVKETNNGQIQQQTEILIDKLIDSVPIIGYDIVKQAIEPAFGKHVSYILLKMPHDQFNKVLHSKVLSTSDKASKLAFIDLERRLNLLRTTSE